MLLFDNFENKSVVGNSFEEFLIDTNHLRLISPYISNGKWNPQKLFDSNPHLEHIDILCDLENPACNPNTVRELAKNQKIKIKYMKGIHAKVYIFDKKVLVTSANFTPNGMGEGLIEAGSVSDETCVANDWYEALWICAKDVPSDNDNMSWKFLIDRWKIARAKNMQLVLSETEKPHIFDLLQSGENFEQFAFCLWYDGDDEVKTTEKDVIKAFPDLKDIPSEKWDFYWEKDSLNRNQSDFDYVDAFCKEFDEKLLINIQINKKNNKPHQRRSLSLSKSMKKRVWGKSYCGKTEICNVYQYVDDVNAFTLANKGKEKQFINLLNEKLENSDLLKKWENWVNDCYGYVSFSDMQKFLGYKS